jgi:hypothetical protein
MRQSAGSRFARICGHFGSVRRLRRPGQAAMVRKGSPVRVRQRALINRAKARFAHFRSGSYDHFRELPSEKGSSMAACQALCSRSRDRGACPAPGPRYRRGTRPRRNLGRDCPANRRRSVRRRPSRAAPASRWSGVAFVTGGLSPVGSSGTGAIATAAPRCCSSAGRDRHRLPVPTDHGGHRKRLGEVTGGWPCPAWDCWT